MVIWASVRLGEKASRGGKQDLDRKDVSRRESKPRRQSSLKEGVSSRGREVPLGDKETLKSNKHLRRELGLLTKVETLEEAGGRE